MATNIDLDKIIRNSKTPTDAMNTVDMVTNGKLSSNERINIAQRILNSSKFKGSSSSGSTNFTGGGSSGGSGGGGGGGDVPSEGGGWLGKFGDSLSNGAAKLAGMVNGLTKVVAKGTALTLESQMGKQGDSTALDIVKTVGEKGFGALINAPGAMLDAVLDQLKKESELLSDVNTKTGISGELSEGLRDSMISASKEARAYGFELSDIGDFYTSLSDQSGKFALINKKTIESAAPVAAALNMSLSELASSLGDYEKVGIGAKQATEAIGNAATKAISLGLNARKVADGMKDSIGKLNEFGFKNGIQGLERMVQKSIEFKISMESVSTIADKVLNPEGAIDLAANLQVLGGAIGDFGDPIKMMYDATNNVEGLQDSLIGAAKGLATYNAEQGRFEITGINLRRAKEMASALNVDYKELTNSAIAAQERTAASSALMSRGFKIDDKEKEFLTNLSRMQDGEMKIVVPESIAQKLGVPTEIALDKLDQKTKDALVANQKEFEKMNPKDMAMSQLTETQKMARDVEVMASWAKIQAAAYIKGGGEAALKNEVKIIKDSMDRVAGKLTVDRQSAQAAGAGTVNAIKKIGAEPSWANVKNAWNTAGDGLGKAFGNNQQAPTQAQQVIEKVQHEVNITASPVADWAKEAAKKDAAFNFEFTNSKGYDILSVAKKKGK